MYLIDTNIVSELRKVETGKINANVAKWASKINPQQTWISVVSISEIQMGILSLARKDDAQAKRLMLWFEQVLLHF